MSEVPIYVYDSDGKRKEVGGTQWRVGRKVPINVYDGDRPVCQCQTARDAFDIVTAMNHQTRANLEIARNLRKLLVEAALSLISFDISCGGTGGRAQALGIALALGFEGGSDEDLLEYLQTPECRGK